MSEPVDVYEKQHMGHDEGLLYREKVSRPRWWNPLFFGLALFLASANLINPEEGWYALAVGLPPLLVAWAVLPVLRIAVTRKHVRIQMGVFGPTIPVASISACELVDVRRGEAGKKLRGFIYNVGGDKRRVVHVRWCDDGGKERTTLVSVNSPERLMEAIAEARASAASARGLLPQHAEEAAVLVAPPVFAHDAAPTSSED